MTFPVAIHTMSTTIKRQPATRRSPRKSPLKSEILHIIPEEDEPRASSSRSPSPLPSLIDSLAKLKLRKPNVLASDIRLRPSLDDDSYADDSLLSVPRPAPKPPVDDIFSLDFADASFDFPHPPTLLSEVARYGTASPTPSISTSSSLSCSPGSQSTGLPVTPSSSDDEFNLPPRASIKPLNIHKLSSSARPLNFASRSDQDSDAESDSEWYSREIQKVVKLSSSLPSSFPRQARPDSSVFDSTPVSPTSRCRSKPLPFTPLQSSPPRSPCVYPEPSSRRDFLAAEIPPPVPPIPVQFRTVSDSSISSNMSLVDVPVPTSVRSRGRPIPAPLTLNSRPPPRSSIPADFGFYPDEEGPAEADEEDNVISYYGPQSANTLAPISGVSSSSQYSQNTTDVPRDVIVTPRTSDSDAYSFQFSFDEDDEPMRLSLPVSPINLQADIAHGLAALRAAEEADDLDNGPSGRVLRSKWSSSTLASIREDEGRRGASAKLRQYFSGSTKKRGSKASSSSNRKSGSGFMSPGLLSPSSSKRSRYPQPLSPSGLRKRDSDIMSGRGLVSPIGATGVRRRGSTSSVATSSAGSVESGSSTSSSGLRRKPIPVEMFLRS